MNDYKNMPAGRRAIFTAMTYAALCFCMHDAHAGALPEGGRFVAGSGSIAQSGASLAINQNSARGVINWNSFSIGDGNSVVIDNGHGATLNRITGGNSSMILGSLSATGSAYLINPQGIVIGSSGIISTGGRFVASTLDTDNASFMSGGPLTLSGPSSHRVVNLGHIGSTNGDVFLVSAGEVDNFGRIWAPNGTAEIAAGRKVLLQDSSTSRQVFVQTGSHGAVWNQGDIAAAQISLQAADGNIFALAGHVAAPRATGTAVRDSHIWLVAESGTVNMAGLFGALNEDGHGGTIDTIARHVAFPDIGPVAITGIWNIVTPEFKFGAPSGRAFAQTLNGGTSISVQTTGAGGSGGDIEVASNLGWTGSGTLTLGAYRNVIVDKGVTIQNKWASGDMALRADATGIDNGGSVINRGTIDWSKSTGAVGVFYDMNGAYTPGVLMSNVAWTAPTYSGLVTQIAGYRLVNSISDLARVTDDLSGNYALGRDLAAVGTFIPPLAYDGNSFTGQFDGLRHVIDGAQLDQTGLFGWVGRGGIVRDVGLTNASTESELAGGLLASQNDGLVTRVYSTGSVAYIPPGTGPRRPGASDFGGLVAVNNGTIAQSWSSAAITGPSDLPIGAASGHLGGLVADNNGAITQSYATGAVSGGSQASIGALVGANSNSGLVTHSFATGLVEGGANGGSGLIGAGGGASADDYWNKETTGASQGGGGVPTQNGLTAAQMRDPASFVGWDFSPSGVWAMPNGADHPVLRWQLPQSSNDASGASL
ncbi:two-partner secretion domain-containing protein [Trinickia sp.]|uniref:two-partner secretion domain-containing protein n=1 Tax=Trinickia sp. TaxID=2571163 RepID=UPI003F7ED1C8